MLKETAHIEPIWELATLFPGKGEWSVEAYLEFEARTGNHLIEFSNGSVEVLPMPSLRHQAIVTYLIVLLQTFVTTHKLGIARVSPTKVRLWEGKIREPDILFVSNENLNQRSEQWFEKADLVMEIVSPDDPNRDLLTKRREYAQAGIPEYWIIDPRSQEILVLTLNKSESSYSVHSVFEVGQSATSALLPEFSISVTELFKQH